MLTIIAKNPPSTCFVSNTEKDGFFLSPAKKEAAWVSIYAFFRSTGTTGDFLAPLWRKSGVCDTNSSTHDITQRHGIPWFHYIGPWHCNYRHCLDHRPRFSTTDTHNQAMWHKHDTKWHKRDTKTTQKRHKNDTGKQHTTGIYVSSTLIAVQPSVSATRGVPTVAMSSPPHFFNLLTQMGVLRSSYYHR